MIPRSDPARSVFFVASAFGVIALLVTSWLIWDEYTEQEQLLAEWMDEVQADAERGAENLDEELTRISRQAETLAERLESERLPVDELEDHLWTVTEIHPDILGFGVVFRPFTYQEDGRLFSRYVVRQNDERDQVAVENFYDYTEPATHTEWYHTALEEPGWQDPFAGQIIPELFALYCAPFALPADEQGPAGDEPDGIVCVNYSLNDIEELVEGLAAGERGYAMILTETGQVVAHPHREHVRQQRNVFEIADELDDPYFHEFGRQATLMESGLLRYFDVTIGQYSWIYYTPILETGWSLAMVVYEDELPWDWDAYRQRHLMIAATAILALIGFVVSIVAGRNFSRSALWIGSSVIALLFVLGMARAWHLALVEVHHTPPDAVMLVDRATTESFLDAYSDDIEARFRARPHRVPTGLAIEHVDVESPDRFTISGIIWCRYTSPDHDDLARGVIFPDAADGEAVLTEAFRHTEANTETIGWTFSVTVHEPADVSRFPLDVRPLRLRIRHRELERHVVLEPDLESYALIHPGARPGLRADLDVRGWVAERTYFTYLFHDYGVEVGPQDVSMRGFFPELTYHTVTRRPVADAFISNQIPVTVAAILLFTLLMLETRREQKASTLGFSTMRTVSVAAAILFTLVVAHIELRRRFVVAEIMYMEYFYLVSYLVIVLVAANGFLLSAPAERHPFIHYADNLLPKVLYWPALLGAFFFVTLWVFY